jgi:hypothetical protein
MSILDSGPVRCEDFYQGGCHRLANNQSVGSMDYFIGKTYFFNQTWAIVSIVEKVHLDAACCRENPGSGVRLCQVPDSLIYDWLLPNNPQRHSVKKNRTGQKKIGQNLRKLGHFKKPPVFRVDLTKHGKTEGILFHSMGVLTNRKKCLTDSTKLE